MEKVSGDNWSYRTKLQSNRHHPKNQHPAFYRPDAFQKVPNFTEKNQPKISQTKISPNNSVAEQKEKSQPYDIHEQKTNEQLIVKRCVQAYFSLLISNVHGSTSCHFLIL